MSGCFNPRTIRLPDGSPQVVRCGKCLDCLSHRQGGWLVRLRQEMNDGAAYFVTLTYSDDCIPIYHCLNGDEFPCVSKADIRHFLLDLRKRFQQGFFIDRSLVPFGGSEHRFELPPAKFKYYLTSELGPLRSRPHYHALFFHLPEDPWLVECLFKTVWRKGFVMVEPAMTEAAGAYVSKYLVNDSLVPHDPRGPRMFAWMSKGLGKSYLDTALVDWHRAHPEGRSYHPHGSKREILPRYWKDKIFDDDMKDRILCGCIERSEALEETLSSMTKEERLDYELNEIHRQEEAVRQARWRFEKKGKIK